MQVHAESVQVEGTSPLKHSGSKRDPKQVWRSHKLLLVVLLITTNRLSKADETGFPGHEIRWLIEQEPGLCSTEDPLDVIRRRRLAHARLAP